MTRTSAKLWQIVDAPTPSFPDRVDIVENGCFVLNTERPIAQRVVVAVNCHAALVGLVRRVARLGALTGPAGLREARQLTEAAAALLAYIRAQP